MARVHKAKITVCNADVGRTDVELTAAVMEGNTLKVSEAQ